MGIIAERCRFTHHEGVTLYRGLPVTKVGALNIPGTYTHCHKSTQLLVAGLPQAQFTTVFMKVICKPIEKFEFQHLN